MGILEDVMHSRMPLSDSLARATGNVGPDYDYGKLGNTDSRGHGSDYGKLPNHPTFSNQSYYSSPEVQGGVWTKSHSGKDMFIPSMTMDTRGLAGYFKEVEPHVVLAPAEGIVKARSK